MEYYCPLCKDWNDLDSCENHFEGTHGNTGVTEEKLKKRFEVSYGGLDLRETPITSDKENIEEGSDENPVFVTNNFRHTR